jgi:hypothetical protein
MSIGYRLLLVVQISACGNLKIITPYLLSLIITLTVDGLSIFYSTWAWWSNITGFVLYFVLLVQRFSKNCFHFFSMLRLEVLFNIMFNEIFYMLHPEWTFTSKNYSDFICLNKNYIQYFQPPSFVQTLSHTSVKGYLVCPSHSCILLPFFCVSTFKFHLWKTKGLRN